MLPGEAILRAPSLPEAARYQAHRPRLERGDAPARGTRRGSSDGMAPWRHLTCGSKARTCRLSGWWLCHHTGRRNSRPTVSQGTGLRKKPDDGGNEVADLSSSNREGARVGASLTPNADGGGSLARRRIHGSRACPRVDHALQRSVGSRSPEKPVCKTSRARCTEAAQAGRRGLGRGLTLSMTKRLPVGPPRERSRGRIRVARRGSGSTERSVARASYRRKAHRTVLSHCSFTGSG
jgi:hypothetical protein